MSNILALLLGMGIGLALLAGGWCAHYGVRRGVRIGKRLAAWLGVLLALLLALLMSLQLPGIGVAFSSVGIEKGSGVPGFVRFVTPHSRAAIST